MTGANETVLSQVSQVPLPDQYFWYVLASAMALTLIWVIKVYLSRIEKAIEQLTLITNRHDTEITVVQRDQENHKERIEELEEFKDSGLADSIIAKIRAITPPPFNGNGHNSL